MDLYVFATPYRVTWDYYFLSREHTFDFKEWTGKAEFEYVSCDFRFLKTHYMFFFFFFFLRMIIMLDVVFTFY